MLHSEGHFTVTVAAKLIQLNITVEHTGSLFNIALNTFVSLQHLQILVTKHSMNFAWIWISFVCLRFQACSQNCNKKKGGILALSVHLSICMEEFGFHQREFYETSYLIVFQKISQRNSNFIKLLSNFQVLYMQTCLYIYYKILLNSSQDQKLFRQSCRENKNTLLMLSNSPLPKSRHL